MKLKKIFSDLCNEIESRTSYGSIYTKGEGVIIVWSNNLEGWYISSFYGKYDGYLGVDKVLVPISKKDIGKLEKLLPILPPLPLYAASFEAKIRGCYDKEVHKKAIKKAITNIDA